MKKSLICASAIALTGILFSGCEKTPADNPVSQIPGTFVYKVSTLLPANYSSQGVNVTVPETMLTVLGLTSDEFTSEFSNSAIKFGHAQSADPSSVVWESENSGGKYGHWFDANGNAAISSSAQILHIQSNCQWGQSSSGVTSFNVNVNNTAYTQGSQYTAYQAIGHTTASGVTDVAFIEWDVTVNNEIPFATGTASFSMTTGIFANIKMISTSKDNEYATLEVPMPETVYAAVKTMSPYALDNLAYFIRVGQIKCYAFPKAAGLGKEGQEFWYDATGAVAEEEKAVVKTSLYLEPGDAPSAGRNVSLLLTPKVGATVTVGDTIKCGFMFMYGTTMIPLTVYITVVKEL